MSVEVVDNRNPENGWTHILLQELNRCDINLPEWTYEASTQGERGDIIWFGEGPVVGGKGPSKRTMPQGDDKVDTPEKSHSVVDLQVEQIPLEETLFVVFDENAAGWGAAWIIWWVEVLRGGDRRRN